MSTRRRIFLIGGAALVLPIVEILLSSLGVALPYRVLVAAVGIAAIGFAAVREFRRVFTDLGAIRSAIDDTARGDFDSPIRVSRRDEVGALADAVLAMRDRLAEMSRRLVESLRIESLNILGSILVHDMKNLSFRLRAVGQNLEANYTDPAFRRSLVNTLNDTTEKMDRMVRRFRERKEMVVVKIRIDVNELMRGALTGVRRDARRIRITEEYGELPLIWADAMLLENALFNIVDNARQAMPRGGRLVVRTRLVENAENGHRHALIEIGDTGVGMSEDFIRDELFAPFVTTKPRGLGLGLYTSQQIVRMHDGEIAVHSEPGAGTAFGIYLPITD
jgi:signal transduction histidine kinase